MGVLVAAIGLGPVAFGVGESLSGEHVEMKYGSWNGAEDLVFRALGDVVSSFFLLVAIYISTR